MQTASFPPTVPPVRMTTNQIVTKEDLQDFKSELLEELKDIFSSSTKTSHKKWLKSAEVRAMLNISPGTLQNYRINGTLNYTKIGGTMYYNQEDIQRLLDKA
jgi:hypothetical protein